MILQEAKDCVCERLHASTMAVFVSAVFEAFRAVYDRRVAPLMRLPGEFGKGGRNQRPPHSLIKRLAN